jgi:hypothetical protein
MAGITDDEALANGWAVTWDAMGRKVYQSPEGFVYDVESGNAIANVDRAAVGESAGFDYYTQATDLIKQGLSIYQLNEQQKAFRDVNKQLVTSGRPPLSWSQFTPTASVGFTADPKILGTVLIVGALVAIAIFGGGRGGRRR